MSAATAGLRWSRDPSASAVSVGVGRIVVDNLDEVALLGRLARYAIITFVVLIALDQVNIGGDIVRQTFLIVLAGVVFALALAFGLGGKEWAAEFLERWWPRRRR